MTILIKFFSLKPLKMLLMIGLTLALLAGAGVRVVSSATLWVVDTDVDENDGECMLDCSLRDAISLAAEGDQIEFGWDMTIFLGSPLELNTSLTIDGRNAVFLSGDSNDDGTGDVRVMTVAEGVNVTLINLEIRHGQANEGGGIYVNGHLDLTGVNFYRNMSTNRGGGVYVSSTGSLQAVDCFFTQNQSAGGGGVYLRSGSSAQIEATTFLSNLAETNNGGAIFNWASQLILTESILIQNSAWVDGGGIYNNGTSYVENVTFYQNSARNWGGAIYTGISDTLHLIHSTLSENSANEGGGVINQASGTMHLINSLIAYSTGGDCLNLGALPDDTANFVMDGGCDAAMSGDPLISPLSDYGGFTQTMALLPGSPAIDAGHSIHCSSTDQRGVLRDDPDGCDIGAFESGGFTLTVDGGTGQSTNVETVFPSPLALTITANTAGEPVGPGGLVRFYAPGTGASLHVTVIPFATDAGGAAAPYAIANGTAGAYQVSAAVTGGDSPAVFDLVNLGDVVLTLEKTISLTRPDAAVAGDSLIYTLTLTNNGTTTASGVTVTDLLPSGVTGEDLNWTGTIEGGSYYQFTIDGTVNAAAGFGAEITNTAYYSFLDAAGEASASFFTQDLGFYYFPLLSR
jgi:uncharacterized repeat protein (TIGR01451 family)